MGPPFLGAGAAAPSHTPAIDIPSLARASAGRASHFAFDATSRAHHIWSTDIRPLDSSVPVPAAHLADL